MIGNAQRGASQRGSSRGLSNPDKAAERLIRMCPPADREIIRRPDVMAVLRENLPNQFKNPESMALDIRNAVRPWGFDLQEVTAPTAIWQGGLDDVHTPATGRYLADHIPNTHLVYEPDYAMFNFIDDFDTILGRSTLSRAIGPRELRSEDEALCGAPAGPTEPPAIGRGALEVSEDGIGAYFQQRRAKR